MISPVLTTDYSPDLMDTLRLRLVQIREVNSYAAAEGLLEEKSLDVFQAQHWTVG